MTDSALADVGEERRGAKETREAQLRSTIGDLIAQDAVSEALQSARTLLEIAPGRRTHRFLREAVTTLDAGRTSLRPLKVALLASFSIEFLHDALCALAFAAGFKLDLYQPPFATFRQEILAEASGLYAARPDVVVLAVEAEDWTPLPFAGFFSALAGGFDAEVARFRDELAQLIASFRSRSSAPLLMHNLSLPAWRKLGAVDAKHETGQTAVLQRMNDAIAALARQNAGIHMVDYAGLVNRHGALNWYDERMKHYAGAPIAGPMQTYLAEEYVRFLRALTGGTKKCLVLDLDNTLWGGVVGEDGVDGIQLGPTYPGSAFLEFQRHLLDLQQRGVILAIASKNNPGDVDEVFASHRAMVLRKEHFSALEIGWEPKSVALQRIAQTLSIGLEHVAFADDNPAECEEVRRALPQVHVIALPTQPERYGHALERAGLFDTLSLSEEDRRRGELYRQRAEALALRSRTGTVEDYYRDLAMELAVVPIGTANLPRASQLTQKTNQFNVTTRRYSEAELALRLSDPAWVGLTVAVRDRFGDHGIVGVALAREIGGTLEIDSFLLSCRVIGRTVETAMLAQLCDEAAARGIGRLRGVIIATEKNAPARDVFERHGFTLEGGEENGETRWRLDLISNRVAWPEWFSRSAG